MRLEQIGVGHGEHGVCGGGDVGGLEPREACLVHDVGQLDATGVGVHGRGNQPRVGERLERLADLGDDGDGLAVEDRLGAVASGVVGGELLGRELLGEVEDGVEGVARVVGEAFASGQGLDVEPVVQQEVEVSS